MGRVEPEDPIVVIAARRLARRARAEAATPEFGRLLAVQAAGAAGDALVALALAGSLFFSVPEATARGRVLAYLALTMAPFAVIAPALSRFLDRHRGSLRAAAVVSTLGRALLAWLLATRLDSLLLFPIAFGVLLLSRAWLVVRGALLPSVIPPGRPLVAANASLSKFAAVAGIVAIALGIAVIRLLSDRVELLVAAVLFAIGAVPARRLPSGRGTREWRERVGARVRARAVTVRQATFATVAMRLLVGFLVFHLAFALRRADVGSLGLGMLVGSAATGALFGALLAPALRRRLREEGIIVGALVVAGAAGIAAGRFFSLAAAAALVFAFGIASGSCKVAFDSVVQRDTPEAARGWAFARYESILQAGWVVGALLPLIAPIPAGAGVAGAGLAANVVALVYVVGRLRVRSAGMA